MVNLEEENLKSLFEISVVIWKKKTLNPSLRFIPKKNLRKLNPFFSVGGSIS